MNYFLIIADENGNEVDRQPISIIAKIDEPESPDLPELPAAIDWYRDAARWWTTGAAALLVFGMSYIPTIGNNPHTWIFSVAAIGLLLSAFLGGLIYIWILELGKTWENLNALTADRANPDRDKSLRENNSYFDSLESRLGSSYYAMSVAFAVGVIALSITVALSTLSRTSQHPDYAFENDRNGQLLALDPTSGEAWAVQSDGDGSLTWQLRIPPISRSSDRKE